MALVKCRECGQRVSDRALKCPHCGAPATVPKRVILLATMGGLVASALGATLLFTRASGGELPEPQSMTWTIGIGAVVAGLAVVLLLVKLLGRSS